MNVEYVNPFLSSLINVLSTMANTKIVPGQPRIKKNEVANGDVSGLIGMVGPTMKGSFSVSFDESLAIEIMFRMLGERPTKIDADVTDMVGEITNMVTGGAKRMLGEKGYEFTMATPIIVSGKNHTITHRCEGPTILMPFTSDFGKVHIEVSFDK